MKKNITDRTIEAVADMMSGIPAEVAALIHDVPYEPEVLTEEQKKAIEEFDKLTDEEKADTIEVDGKTYIRKIWEKNHQKRHVISRADAELYRDSYEPGLAIEEYVNFFKECQNVPKCERENLVNPEFLEYTEEDLIELAKMVIEINEPGEN